MSDNKKLIKNIATELNVHPIHLRMFMANFKCELENIKYVFEECNNKSPKPFVKWVGGKRQLAKQFRDLDLYPPDEFNPDTATYFEPFIGGGAMFFDLLPNRAVISDLNSELITTYKIIKSDVEALIEKLKIYQKKNDKEDYLKIRAKNINKLNDVDIAARFIYLNRTGYNGLYRVNRSGGFNVPFGKNTNPLICDENNLRKVSKSLKNIKIFYEDYKEVLGRAKKGDFIYFDPPYYPVSPTASFTGYTKEGFLEKEQRELRDIFVKLHKRGCFVMLSNSDTPFINKIYSDLDKKIKIHKVFAGRAINSKGSGRGKIKEVVVVSY